MTVNCTRAALALALALLAGPVWAGAGHSAKPDRQTDRMQEHMGGMMGEGMLATPKLDPARGRRLFAEKGCVVCHSVNGVGGEDAPSLDASTMRPMMNPFEFAAKMWDGAEAMVYMQREELGEPIRLTGRDLADIIAFVHSHEEQSKFAEEDVPEPIRELIAHAHGEGGEDEDHKD